MNKKILPLALFLLLLLPTIPYVMALNEEVSVRDPSHYIVESIGDPETVDPAWAYDTASAGLIFQVYETLVQFDTERTDTMLPLLAKSFYRGPPARATFTHTGDPVVKTWYFKLQTGVKFHSGNTLSPADAEYSIEHILVQDRSGGPEWMLYEALLGRYHANMAWPEDNTCPINEAVESNSTHVWFNFVGDFPDTPFLQIWAQSWASIIDKDFFVANGDWPGTFNNWKSYHNPGTAPIDVAGNLMSGTGPFKLDYWIHGVEWSVVKFGDYWQGFPDPDFGNSLNRLTEKVVYEWSTRLADIRAGTADSVYVPRAYISAVEGWPGIRGMRDIPTLSHGGMFINFQITTPSPYIGSGALDGNGIPPDFFSDHRIREAFANSFEYDTYLADMFLGEAEQPPSPHIRGLSFSEYVWDGGTLPNGTYLAPIPKFSHNLANAAALFQAASADSGSPAYQVWTKGFKMTITYNAGNVARETAATIIATNVEKAFNDYGGAAVDITTLAVTWSTYLGEFWYYPSFRSIYGLFILGWLADYPDPHNFVMPYQHTYGDFVYPCSYSNPAVDALIEEGMATPYEPYPGPPADPTLDIYNKRPAIYHEIAQKYYEDIPSIGLYQATGRRWERDWVQAWYYNPIFPMTYYRHVWKGIDGDVDGDDAVGVLDAGKVSAHWYSAGVSGPDGWNRIAEIFPTLQYTPAGLATLGWPTGVSVGEIDVYDWAFVNDNFFDILSPATPRT